jgi:hypothetical protein
MSVYRLGTAPGNRTGVDRSMQGSNCPDVFQLGDMVLVIGTHLQGGDLLGMLPPDASVGPEETVVRIPLSVFLDAALDLVKPYTKEEQE